MNDNQVRATIANSYSTEEVRLIYSLGRFYLESGSYHSAENIFNGLCNIAPDYVPAWLGRAVVNFLFNRMDDARTAAAQANRLMPESIEAQLMLICVLLSIDEYTDAGARLGEIKELIDTKRLTNPDLIRFFKSQLVRFENRAN